MIITREEDMDEAEKAMMASLKAEMRIQRKKIEEWFGKPETEEE